MIEKGQIWVCIKKYDVEETSDGDIIGTYLINDRVEVVEFTKFEDYAFYTPNFFTSKEDFYDRGYIIKLNIFIRYLRVEELLKHFIPLAEWREQQIKTILDD